MLNFEVEFLRTYAKNKKNVGPTELFLPSKPRSISGTLQRFDYGHSGHEKFENLFEVLSVAKPVLNQSEYSLELTSSWNQSNC